MASSTINPQTTAYLASYGKASQTVTRFQLLGDNRVMYSLQAAGSTMDASTPPHHISSGSPLAALMSGGHRNMICNSEGAFAFGAKHKVINTAAIRLGVAGTAGGNMLVNFNEYGVVHATQRIDAGNHYTYVANGEPVYQDTNATGSQYGASVEQFVTNVGGTVAVSGATVTGTGTTFTTAALTGAYAYTPSLNSVQAGDLILITDGGSKYWHRITGVTDNTHLSIYPNWIGTGTGGKAYSIWRSGYGSYSRIIPIYNSSNGTFYNYYVGLHRSTSFPGTIMCFTREASGAASSVHFTCPQNSAAQNIKAQDIAYYKQFLLYGYGSTIGWSAAGFPNDFTTGFKSTDFPAGNISAVAINDQFVSFEYLGEQLIAMFKDSIWEVQATGTVPEFNFYKLPEPIGPILQPTTSAQTGFMNYRRPTCSGRNAVYYHSHVGMMELSGGVAKTVSRPVRGVWQQLDSSGAYNPAFSWEPATNSVFCVTPIGTSNSSDFGLVYNVDQDMWSVYDPGNANNISLTMRGSSCTPIVDGFCLFGYNGDDESVIQVDSQSGAPFATSPGNSVWQWTTPVVSLGSEYGQFIMTGFQLDGNFDINVTWTIYGGKTPFAVNVPIKSGTTIPFTDNRRIMGMKVDFPFVKIVFSTSDGAWASLFSCNIYAEIQGN